MQADLSGSSNDVIVFISMGWATGFRSNWHDSVGRNLLAHVTLKLLMIDTLMDLCIDRSTISNMCNHCEVPVLPLIIKLDSD
jgi:hypothetical protein